MLGFVVGSELLEVPRAARAQLAVRQLPTKSSPEFRLPDQDGRLASAELEEKQQILWAAKS